MEDLIIQETQYTPKIVLDYSLGLIDIRGKSYPENSFEFYYDVMNWIENYVKITKNSKTIINMEIIYFNSSSSKLFFDLFDLFDDIRDKHDVEINWIYDQDNESALESGKDYHDDFKNLNINLVKK